MELHEITKSIEITGVSQANIHLHLQHIYDTCEKYNIKNPYIYAGFMANCLHESANLTQLVENTSYSANRMAQIWPHRFAKKDEKGTYIKENGVFVPNDLAISLHKDGVKFANYIYGKRMGNREEGDGYKYRGRGVIMLTGRSNYETFGALIHVNLIDNPQFASYPEYCWKIAAEFFRLNSIFEKLENKDLRGARLIINGGLIGFDDVKYKYQKILKIFES